jgi:glutamate N-acetyltransferase/amino-acid N-acetyltransferase
MAGQISVVENGSVTLPKGFQAGATYAGLRTYSEDKRDLGILFSELPASAAATFSTNRILSPSVTTSKKHIASGRARAVIANSGCANTCVGEAGFKDALEMTSLAGAKLNLPAEEVLVCSTGIIGVELPMGLIRTGIEALSVSPEDGNSFARAILTTDSVTKEEAVSFPLGGRTVHLAGCAKGSGMIHPNMATMLSFLTTDVAMAPGPLQAALKRAVDISFNMISIDGDSSTNDTVILLANGAAGAPEVLPDTPEAALFQEALEQVCVALAKAIVRDGEGATKLFEVIIEGARSRDDARVAARSVSSSMLVKTAVHGNDPNWGRLMMALGKSGAEVEEPRISLFINDVCIMEGGLPIPFFKDAIVASMKESDSRFRILLGLGDASAMAWGCDLSDAYVVINSAYTT